MTRFPLRFGWAPCGGWTRCWDTWSNFVEVTRGKAADWDDVVKTGRTHLQDAVPVRLGQEVGAWATAIERQIDKVKFAADGLRRLGIGGTAAGTGLNAHPEYHARMVAKLSELSGIKLTESDDLFESMQSMQDAVFFSAALRNLAMDFTRIANDVRLLSAGPTTGIAELTCPTVQPGSSIMPGKVNPVLAEMMNQAMYHVMGNDTTVNLCGAAGQFELNVMMPVIAHNLNEMMTVMIGAVGAFTNKLMAGLIIESRADGKLAVAQSDSGDGAESDHWLQQWRAGGEEGAGRGQERARSGAGTGLDGGGGAGSRRWMRMR